MKSLSTNKNKTATFFSDREDCISLYPIRLHLLQFNYFEKNKLYKDKLTSLAMKSDVSTELLLGERLPFLSLQPPKQVIVIVHVQVCLSFDGHILQCLGIAMVAH